MNFDRNEDITIHMFDEPNHKQCRTAENTVHASNMELYLLILKNEMALGRQESSIKRHKCQHYDTINIV